MVHYERLWCACRSCLAWVLPAGEGDSGGYGSAMVFSTSFPYPVQNPISSTPGRRVANPKEQTPLIKQQHPLYRLPNLLPRLPLPHRFPSRLRRFEELGCRVPVTTLGNDASPANARHNRWAQVANNTANDGISDAWRRTESGEGAGKGKG